MKNLFCLFAFVVVCHLMGAEGWVTSIEEAQKEALKAGKDIFVDFTGSDWCIWCQRLKHEVFDTKVWKDEAPKNYVFVEIDFPKKKQLSPEQTKYNANLAKKYEIQGYPTICLLDKEGKIYAKTGYQQGGPEKYLAHLKELVKVRDQRDQLLKEVNQGSSDQNKIQALDKLIEVLEKNDVSFAYFDLQEKIVAMDNQNQYKMNAKYSSQLYRYYYAKKMMEKDNALKAEYEKKSELYWANLKKYDPQEVKNIEIQLKLKGILEQHFQKNDWQGGVKALEELLNEKPTNEAAQQIHYLLGAAHFELNNKPKSLECLKEALKHAPDSELAARIKMILPMIEKEIEKAKETTQKQEAPQKKEETPKKDKEETPKKSENPQNK